MRLGVQMPDPPDLLERAVRAAADADAAVVVVGTNDEWETEGEDRTTMALPGDQDELVRRVAAVNEHTVVVVNANGTDARAFEHTLFNLDGVGTDIAGIVVNRFDAPTSGSKYNQGYTYEYTKEYHERS